MFVKCFLKFYAQLFGFVFLADVAAFISANRFLLSSNASPFDAAPAVIVVLLTLFAAYRRFCKIKTNKKKDVRRIPAGNLNPTHTPMILRTIHQAIRATKKTTAAGSHPVPSVRLPVFIYMTADLMLTYSMNSTSAGII